MKIKVKPEGREGVWLADKDSLKAWITEWIAEKDFDMIHNMRDAGFAVLGADWNIEDVLGRIDLADRVAVLTGKVAKGNFGHALSVITGNSMDMFDIGEITVDDLEIATEKCSECGHQHQGARLGYICIGCPCPGAGK